MGRGLSNLQQSILRLALKGTKRRPKMVTTSIGTYDTNAHRPHVTQDDVLIGYYGEQRMQRRPYYALKVFPQTSEHNRATAAVSRAFRRLLARDLLVSRYHYEGSRLQKKYPSGYDLTEHGAEIAKGLTVKTFQTRNKS